MWAYSHEKDQNTLKIEFLERKVVEQQCDILSLKENLYNTLKTLSEQFVELNNSFVEVVEKMKKLEHVKKEKDIVDRKTEQSVEVREKNICSMAKDNQSQSPQLQFKCEKCEYECPNKITFQKHCNTKHAEIEVDKESGFECLLCKDRLTTSEDFDEHVAEHLDEIENMDIASLTNGHDLF